MKFKAILFIFIFLTSILNAKNKGLHLGNTQNFNDAGDFNISVSAKESSMKITMPTMDVEKFVIYRSTQKNGAFKKIKITKKNIYTDQKIKKGINYYYVAVALKKTKKKGKKKWEKTHSNKATAIIEEVITDVKVVFNSTPKNAVVIINNQNIGKTPVTKKFKLGIYQLTMQKEGYKTYKDFNFSVDYKKKINVNIKLKKIKASLTITTVPSDATIKINNKTAGKSPLRKENLNFGKYKIKAALKGFKSVKKVVVINSETPAPVNIIFEKEPRIGAVYINSIPKGAYIFIDNVKYGRTPFLIKKLNAGIHTLILRKKYYNELKNEIEIEVKKRKSYNFSLVKENGFLSVTTFPDSAECYLNNKLIGQTPINSLKVNKGIYNLVIKKEYYSDFKEMINIKIEAHVKRDIILSLKKATLSINTYPEKAKIMINGMNYGITPFISDNIQPGEIKVDIIKEGFETISEEVTLSAGSIEKLSYTLNPIQEQEVIIKKGTLSVMTTPSHASVYLNNKLYSQTPAILSLEPAQYSVRMKKQNHKDWTGQVIINSEETREININLIPFETFLSINSSPENAGIYLNNIFYGKTPQRFKVTAGDYVVNLKMPKYDTYSSRLKIIGSGQEISKTYRLKKEIKKTIFDSTPRNSEVLLNNKIIGVTPFKYFNIKDGIYNISFRKTGYRKWNKQIRIYNGEPSKISANLEALKGDLLINSIPSLCNVYIDNKRYGISGRVIKNISAGYHNIKLQKYGYYDITGKIQVFDNKLASHKFKLIEKPMGNIKVDSNPLEANVYLNKVYKGVTPIVLKKLPEDKYRLRLKKSGYRSFYTTVNVIGNRTEYVKAHLVKGSDCCLGSSLITKPVLWYIASAVCLAGAGWSWYEEERALKKGDGKRRSELHKLRNGLAITGGACLVIGVTFHFAR